MSTKGEAPPTERSLPQTIDQLFAALKCCRRGCCGVATYYEPGQWPTACETHKLEGMRLVYFGPQLEELWRAVHSRSALPAPSTEPNLYACGCSKHKVKAGLCDVYDENGNERSQPPTADAETLGPGKFVLKLVLNTKRGPLPPLRLPLQLPNSDVADALMVAISDALEELAPGQASIGGEYVPAAAGEPPL